MNTREAIVLYKTHCHDLFYIFVYSHENIPNDIQSRGSCQPSRGDNSESIKVRVVIRICDTS